MKGVLFLIENWLVILIIFISLSSIFYIYHKYFYNDLKKNDNMKGITENDKQWNTVSKMDITGSQVQGSILFILIIIVISIYLIIK